MCGVRGPFISCQKMFYYYSNFCCEQWPASFYPWTGFKHQASTSPWSHILISNKEPSILKYQLCLHMKTSNPDISSTLQPTDTFV